MTTAEPWKLLEIEYGRRMRAASRAERKALYAEANSAVAVQQMATLPADPERRASGTSAAIVSFLRRHCRRGDDVLEVGCGSGYTCWKLAPRIRSIVGTDVSEPRLREAEELLRRNGTENAAVRAVAADELVAAFGPESFDRVISVDVYEHLLPEDGAAHLREVWSVLRPGGEYILITANRLAGPTDVTQDLFPDATEAMGFHFNETTHQALSRELRAAGFARIACAWRAPKALPFAFHVCYPLGVAAAFERAYARLRRKSLPWRMLRPFVTITLVAAK